MPYVEKGAVKWINEKGAVKWSKPDAARSALRCSRSYDITAFPLGRYRGGVGAKDLTRSQSRQKTVGGGAGLLGNGLARQHAGDFFAPGIPIEGFYSCNR